MLVHGISLSPPELCVNLWLKHLTSLAPQTGRNLKKKKKEGIIRRQAFLNDSGCDSYCKMDSSSSLETYSLIVAFLNVSFLVVSSSGSLGKTSLCPWLPSWQKSRGVYIITVGSWPRSMLSKRSMPHIRQFFFSEQSKAERISSIRYILSRGLRVQTPHVRAICAWVYRLTSQGTTRAGMIFNPGI